MRRLLLLMALVFTTPAYAISPAFQALMARPVAMYSFESGLAPWTIYDPEGLGSERYTDVAHSGTYSVKINLGNSLSAALSYAAPGNSAGTMSLWLWSGTTNATVAVYNGTFPLATFYSTSGTWTYHTVAVPANMTACNIYGNVGVNVVYVDDVRLPK